MLDREKLRAEFKEYINEAKENTELTKEYYDIAKKLSSDDTVLDDYAYKYGDSDDEINKATSEPKWKAMKAKYNDEVKNFKLKTKMDYSTYIKKYEKQLTNSLKDVKPKTVEGKMFKLIMDVKKNTGIGLITPEGDASQSGLVLRYIVEDNEIFLKTRWDKTKQTGLSEKDKKDIKKCIEYYTPLISYGSTSFRKIVSKNNSSALEEITQIINKYVPNYYDGFYSYTKNW